MHAAVRSLSLAGLLIVLIMASGCATVVKGSKQSIGVQTDPEGASCELVREGQVIGSVSPTPGEVEVEKDKDNIEVTCKKKGFNPASDSISSSFQQWTLGNLLIGGIIGVAIDAGSGAAMQYPPAILLKMTPEKFANTEDREDFFEKWRSEVLQNSTKAKIAAAKTCTKEQCDEIVKRIDRETEQALAGIDANRNMRNNAASANATSPAPASVQTAQPGAVTTAVAIEKNSTNGSRWYPAKGDRWRYKLIDGRQTVGTINVEVMETGDGRVRERFTKDGSPGFSLEREVPPEFVTQAFQPSIQLPGGYQMIDFSAYFPPGSKLVPNTAVGTVSGDVYIQTVGLRKVAWDTRVLGSERVKVPAGEFEAWKVQATTTVNTQYGDMKVVYDVWYSTLMNRAIKIGVTSRTGSTTTAASEFLELAAFDKAQ